MTFFLALWRHNVNPTVSCGLLDSRSVCCRFKDLAALIEDDDGDDNDDAGSVISHAQTDDDVTGPSIEEIDAAVREVSADLPYSGADSCKL